MSDSVDLNIERLRRATDNSKLTPADLLTLVDDWLKSDEAKSLGTQKRMFIIVESEGETRNTLEYFRCGTPNRQDEVAFLSLALHHAIDLWYDK